MRKLLFTVFAFCLFTVTHAQQQEIDSLQRQINRAEIDTLTFDALCRLATLYTYTKADSALVLTQESLRISQQKNWRYRESRANSLLGSICLSVGNIVQSLEHYLKALKIAEEQKSDRMMSAVFGNLGNVYSELGDEEMAIHYTMQQLIVCERSGNDERRCSAMLNLGDSYEKLNRLDSARLYTTMCYDLSIKLGHRVLEALSLCNLRNIYSRMNQSEIAMGYYRASLPISREFEEFPVIT